MSYEVHTARLAADQDVAAGDLLMLNTTSRHAVLYTTDAGHIFLGVAYEDADSTGEAAGAITVRYFNGLTELTPTVITPSRGEPVYGLTKTTFDRTVVSGQYIGRAIAPYTGAAGSTKWTVDTRPAFAGVPTATS